MLTIRHKMQQMAIKYEFQKQNGGVVTSKREQEKLHDENHIILEVVYLKNIKSLICFLNFFILFSLTTFKLIDRSFQQKILY